MGHIGYKALLGEGGALVALGLYGRQGYLVVLDGFVGDPAEQVGDAIDAGAALVIRLDHEPGAILGVRIDEHVILGAGILDPARAGMEIHGAEFPAFDGGMDAVEEALLLLFVRYREPVLDDNDARAGQHALEFGAGAQKLAVFVVLAKAHHSLDASPVVPGAVEQYHLTGGGQVGGVTLEVPLGAFAVGGGGQGRDLDHPWVELGGDGLDDPAFARGIAPFEQDHDLEPLLFDPLLQLDELGLQIDQCLLILFLAKLGSLAHDHLPL